MKQRLKNQNGTTLVELIVCMVLLSLFTLAAVTLIQPSAQAYMDIQQQTRAQNLADALIETIRGEVLEANGYIRFTDGATDPNNLDSVFLSKGNDYSKGTALEFSVYPNHIELIDKDCVPPLTKTDGTALLTAEQANALNGYLHMRFYQQSGTDNSPQHTATDENTKQVTQKYVAYAYTTAYPKDAYMGLYIKDLHFYARSYQKPKNGSKYARVTAITVVLTIAKKDANGQSVTLCTQKAIIALPGEPVYIEKPGTWDGKASSES
jgi:Tfp pilus assembly protein PilW